MWVGPVSADRAQQATRKGLISLPLGRLAGRRQGGDEAALAVEHDDRLKSVFVVVGVEQLQLLTTVDRIERVVDVQRDPFGNRGEGPAIQIDHRPAHPQQGANVRQIPSNRDIVDCEHNSRSMGERSSAILEHRITAQRIGVVAVLVAGALIISSRNG